MATQYIFDLYVGGLASGSAGPIFGVVRVHSRASIKELGPELKRHSHQPTVPLHILIPTMEAM